MRRLAIPRSQRHHALRIGTSTTSAGIQLGAAVVPLQQRWASSASSGSSGTPLFDFFGSIFGGGDGGSSRRSFTEFVSHSISSTESSLATQFNQVLLESCGMSWPLALVTLGFCIRLFGSLYFSLAAERATINLRRAAPELAPAVAEFDLVYRSKSTAMDLTIAGAKLKAERKRVYAKYKTSNKKAFLTPLLSAPLVLGGLHFVSVGLPAAFPDFSTMGAEPKLLPLYGADMSLPDHTNVTGNAAMLLTVANLELSVRNKRNGVIADRRYKILMRCVYLGFVVFPALNMPVGIQCYWVGLGLAGILHPILMRSDAFRNWFGAPSLEVPRLDEKHGGGAVSNKSGSTSASTIAAASTLAGSDTGKRGKELPHLKSASIKGSGSAKPILTTKDVRAEFGVRRDSQIKEKVEGEFVDPENLPWHAMDPLTGDQRYSKLTNTEALIQRFKLVFPKLAQSLNPAEVRKRDAVLNNEREGQNFKDEVKRTKKERGWSQK